MSKSKKTHIVFVLDQSGSMQAMEQEAVSGYNTFLAEQQKIKTPATLTLVLFDTVVEAQPRIDLQAAEPLVLGKTYQPRATTALLDAVGQTIAALKGKKRVIFGILTDGMENASKEYRHDQIKQMIDEQTKAGWEFHYLAADPASFAQGIALGIQPDKARQFDPSDPASIARGYVVTTNSVAAYRSR